MHPDPDLMTTQDVADKLKVSGRTVERLRDEQGLPAVWIGKRCVRYRPAAIDAWIAEQEAKREQAV